jgi:hypothetical protein
MILSVSSFRMKKYDSDLGSIAIGIGDSPAFEREKAACLIQGKRPKII